MNTEFKDTGSERALIGTIINNGRDAFIDSQEYLGKEDFSLHVNKVIWESLEGLFEDHEDVDIESVKLKAVELGYNKEFEGKQNLEYLEILPQASFSTNNINKFCYRIKKQSILKNLFNKYSETLNYLSNLEGNENLSDIVQQCESNLTDSISGLFGEESTKPISNGLSERIQEKLESDPVDQIGIPTGFVKWDKSIGGGLRRGTVNVIGARAKTGKSFHAINVARNVSYLGVPTLYLDTELTEEHQQDRLVAIDSQIPLNRYERSDINENEIDKLKQSEENINSLPLYYENISGKTYDEALSLARRWLVRSVGFGDNGKANDCVIIYDYLKLTASAGLTKSNPEYIELGRMLTRLHDFTVQYDIPMLGFVQLNRQGIEQEDGSVIAGSDRILWLCSSFSILSNKDQTDEDSGCGWSFGNKRLRPIESRYGPGLSNEADYINLFSSLKPNVTEENATGRIEEGMTFSEVYFSQGSSEVQDN